MTWKRIMARGGVIMTKMSNGILTTALGVSMSLCASGVAFSEEGESDGNRYYLERYYTEDISSAKAFLDAVVRKGKWSDKSDPLVIVDVRDASEYARGHPDRALHVPYPRIYRECVNDNRSEDGGSCTDGVEPGSTEVQDPEDFFLEVEERIPDKSTRIATLCRTGFRSVLAGNILARPDIFLGPSYAGRGYENIFNIWEGYVGLPKPGVIRIDGVSYVVGSDQPLTDLTLPDGSAEKGFVAYDLDLNNDEDITAADKDGWRYYQGLPFETKLKNKLISKPVDAEGYYDAP
jgi:rhodanese-related sulfurtransferase